MTTWRFCFVLNFSILLCYLNNRGTGWKWPWILIIQSLQTLWWILSVMALCWRYAEPSQNKVTAEPSFSSRSLWSAARFCPLSSSACDYTLLFLWTPQPSVPLCCCIHTAVSPLSPTPWGQKPPLTSQEQPGFWPSCVTALSRSLNNTWICPFPNLWRQHNLDFVLKYFFHFFFFFAICISFLCVCSSTKRLRFARKTQRWSSLTRPSPAPSATVTLSYTLSVLPALKFQCKRVLVIWLGIFSRIIHSHHYLCQIIQVCPPICHISAVTCWHTIPKVYLLTSQSQQFLLSKFICFGWCFYISVHW